MSEHTPADDGAPAGCPSPSLLGFPEDPALLADGWVRRFIVDPGREAEVTDLYRASGFEVRAEPLDPETLPDLCRACGEVICRSYRMIYTRAGSR